MLILPDIEARTILADPPVAFATRSRKGEGRPPQHHYGCLSFEELAAIPVTNIAAPNCFLLLWIPLRSVFLVEHNVEICWLERRGSPRRKSAGVRELIIAPVREHSRKPDEVYARVEPLSNGPYLCLRDNSGSCTCVGDEVGKFRREAAQ